MEAIHREKLFSLSNSVKLLLAKIGSTELVDSFRKTKLDALLLTKLKRRLTRIVVLLNDDAVFNEWFDMVRDAVFELESLFDEINTEALRRKVEAESAKGFKWDCWLATRWQWNLKYKFHLNYFQISIDSEKEMIVEVTTTGSNYQSKLISQQLLCCRLLDDVEDP